MTPPIRWRASAVDDLDAIVEYIADFDPQAAESMRDRVGFAIMPLADHPYLFRPGRVLRSL